MHTVISRDNAIHKNPVPGANGRIVHGDALTLATWTFSAGTTTLPAHSHPHEQVTTVVSGTLKLRIGDSNHTLEAGDSAVIPGDVEHEATAVTEAIVADAFHPVREDLQYGPSPLYPGRPSGFPADLPHHWIGSPVKRAIPTC